MFFSNYWHLTVPVKTRCELDADLWLLRFPHFWHWDRFMVCPCLRFRRMYLLLVSFLVCVCIGTVFSFSILFKPINVYFEQDEMNGNAMYIYFEATLALGLTSAWIGPWLEKNGPRLGMICGTILAGIGFTMAHLAMVCKSQALLHLGFGIFVGVSYGIILIAILPSLQRWFPDLRGLVSGLCILGLGVGTGLWTFAITKLLKRDANFIDRVSLEADNNGLRKLFAIQGAIAIVVFAIGTVVVRTPPCNFLVNGYDMHCVPSSRTAARNQIQSDFLKVGMTLVNYEAVESEATDGTYYKHVRALTLVQCICSSDFIWLYIAFAANIIPLVLFLSEMYDVVSVLFHETNQNASSFMSQLFLCACCGRLMGPLASDLVIRVCYTNPAVARKGVFAFLLVLQCIAAGILTQCLDNVEMFRWPAYVLVFGSVGAFAIMPCFVTDMFGVYNSGTMYGLLLSSWSIGLGVVILFPPNPSAITLDSIHSQLIKMLIILAIGCFALMFVRTNSMDRFYCGYQLTICGKTLLQIPSRRRSLNITQALTTMNDSVHLHTSSFIDYFGHEPIDDCDQLSEDSVSYSF